MSKCIDLSGQKFGRLTVIKRDMSLPPSSGAMWLCQCDCGKVKSVRAHDLKSGRTKSCGCYNREKTINRNTIHNQRHTRLYGIWLGIKNRCDNQRCKSYRVYGAEGKTVCEEWSTNFQAFYEWATNNGYKDNLTIERIDGSKGYSPENCRWATKKEQANNTRRNHLVTYRGRTQTLRQWAEETGINSATIRSRLKAGWDINRVFSPSKNSQK